MTGWRLAAGGWRFPAIPRARRSRGSGFTTPRKRPQTTARSPILTWRLVFVQVAGYG